MTRTHAAQELVDAHVAAFEPLLYDEQVAEWNAATSGDPAAIQASAEARTRIKMLHSDASVVKRIRELLGGADDLPPLLHRQLLLLDHAFTRNQLPEATIQDLSAREAEVEAIFQSFRATIDGERKSNNELLEILRHERDEGKRRAAWEASKQIGRKIAPLLLELVRRRNAAARELGFANYYEMGLLLQELQPERLFALMDEFRAATEEPFRALRREIDAGLAARFSVAPEELRPWHWEDFFSQHAPSLGEVSLDELFKGRDAIALANEFFRGIGLPVDDVLANSDLWEREGKDQNAFCIDMDRGGDVRILCNLRGNERWAMTLLHELGHAVYDRYLPAALPFLLREPAHIMATEAMAMWMGRLTRDPSWLREMLGAEISAAEASDIREQLRALMLVSARWMLVMVFFERELYRDPDRPDLNRLWWDLVGQMQLIPRPEGRDEPDWATKNHLSNAPVYYHNYLLGELMASQFDAALKGGNDSGPQGWRDPGLGQFFRERVFAPGASVTWDQLAEHATGEPLSGRFFAEQFVGT